jgi:hypothetical protein
MHEYGCGVEMEMPLQAGAAVTVIGDRLHAVTAGCTTRDTAIPARIAWCLQKAGSRYRAGIAFSDAVEWPPETARATAEREPAAPPEGADYYEMLQLSPNADLETIHRVYRLLAQRFHPDNGMSGDDARFRQVLEAYRVLSDPERRAAYDAGYEGLRRTRWRVFDQGRSAQGAESERLKRQGILALLYTKRLNSPEQPGMTVMEVEDLLGIPREHLEFGLWYLKDSGFLQRTDNGRYFITVRGVDEAEKSNRWWQRPDKPLLEDGRRQEGGAAPAA